MAGLLLLFLQVCVIIFGIIYDTYHPDHQEQPTGEHQLFVDMKHGPAPDLKSPLLQIFFFVYIS